MEIGLKTFIARPEPLWSWQTEAARFLLDPTSDPQPVVAALNADLDGYGFPPNQGVARGQRVQMRFFVARVLDHAGRSAEARTWYAAAAEGDYPIVEGYIAAHRATAP